MLLDLIHELNPPFGNMAKFIAGRRSEVAGLAPLEMRGELENPG